MANGTQVPTVVAAPSSVGTGGTPPVTPPGTPTTGDPTGGLLSFLGGIGSLLFAKPDMNLASEYAGQATSGATSALDRMTQFLANPSSITQLPGYEFGMNQGMEAVNRGAGASGMLNSGNRLAALQNFGQNYAGTWMDRMWQELMGNTQASIGVGGLDLSALMQLMNAKNQQQTQIGSGMAGIAAGLPAAINAGSGIWNAINQAFSGGSSGGGFNTPPTQEFTGPTDPNAGGFDPFTPMPITDMTPPDWTSGFDLGGG